MEEFLLRFFRATSFDLCDSCFWRTDGEYAPLSIFVNCNDLFYWAMADCETLTPENIEVFEQSIKDTNKAINNENESNEWGPLLFCARVRKMRPQTPYYKYIPDTIKNLFNECGPERNE